MQQVLSLIAADAKTLRAADVDTGRRALDSVSLAVGDPDWLSPGDACDVPFDGNAGHALEAARHGLGDRPIDVNIIPPDHRRKNLIVADMDSTMIRQECIDELAAEAGLRDRIAAITERAMRGEIAFAPALRERVALLRGLASDVIERVLDERIELMPGAKVLIATMRAAGAHSALVSGGFTAFVEPIAARIGFHETRANRLLSEGGTFTGLVAEPILGAKAKEQTLVDLTARLRLVPEETLAVGDGANDSSMIIRAGLGVGFHAKPALRRVADATIDHADLTALLFLQGFRRDEFASCS